MTIYTVKSSILCVMLDICAFHRQRRESQWTLLIDIIPSIQAVSCLVVMVTQSISNSSSSSDVERAGAPADNWRQHVQWTVIGVRTVSVLCPPTAPTTSSLTDRVNRVTDLMAQLHMQNINSSIQTDCCANGKLRKKNSQSWLFAALTIFNI